jgi:hypothetical protein
MVNIQYSCCIMPCATTSNIAERITELKSVAGNDGIHFTAAGYQDMGNRTIGCLKTLIVPDSKSRNIPEVVLVRRGTVGVLGIWKGWDSWVKGGVNGVSLQATCMRGRWTIPVTAGGCQVSRR